VQKKTVFVLIFHLLCAINAFAELRAFNDIFPNLSPNIQNAVFSDSGYIKSSQKENGFNLIGNSVNVDGIAPQIINEILSKKPGYLVEYILVIPGKTGAVTLLDVYNALGNVRNLKGRLYNSATRNQAVPLFEDATRIKSEKQTTAIPDPAPAGGLPASETVFIRLKDVNFGNTYYRGEMTLVRNGLCYSLSNFKSMTYFFIPVIKEGNFTAKLYFEPIYEGILIYSIAGTDVSDFVASRVHMSSAIAKRLEVITSWAAEGISKIK